MSTAKRKAPAMKTKPKEEVNVKALAWIGAVVVVIIAAVAVLLIVNQ
ncbi:hypothetical protein [Paenibacillus lupini]|jgi:hypothetical protein|nr:hypothetical protein [Paenibacillus lupini]NIK20854.1 hypothetical protein [Paenibacillus lupini]